MDSIEALLKSTNMNMENMDIEVINGFLCTTYLKDTKGKYITCNQNQLMTFGISNVDELVGLYDYDLMNGNEAALLRENDKRVLTTTKQQIFTEGFTRFDGKKLLGTSFKMLVRSQTQKIIGVIGLSLLNEVENSDKGSDNDFKLSKRQLDCLACLVKGFTGKQTSNALKLSQRTVEHYVEAIKLKMKCSRRSDLISKALLIPEIKARLERDFIF